MRIFVNALLVAAAVAPSLSQAQTLSEALTGGKVYGDLRLRYESVEQDNGLGDAAALTLRSRLGYQSLAYQGFSAQLEFEDSRIVAGQGEFSVPPVGYKSGRYSVIADPETTELDQAFVRYQRHGFSATLGRQVMSFDDQRFIGAVGWRQDRQTFDALALTYKASDTLNLSYAYIGQRNGIFAEQADKQSKDSLFNLRLDTGLGVLSAYSYLLELDEADEERLDTAGLSLAGARDMGGAKLLYRAEYAQQRADGVDADADFAKLETGVAGAGLTAKLGYEVLGSDGGKYGFTTPLATLHKFNGWADIFLKTPAGGLVDRYASLGGALAGGKWLLAYHDYRADKAGAGPDRYGSEVNALYSRSFAKHYSFGVKFAAYSADELAVDTDKFWLWFGAAF